MSNKREEERGGTAPDIDWGALAEYGDAAVHNLNPDEPQLEDLSLIQRLIRDRPTINPAEAMADITTRLGLEDRLRHLTITDDPIGLLRKLSDGKIEKYLEKQIRERLKGKPEAAAYDKGLIGENEVIIYSMNWEFMGGSLGAVAGEKFQRAAEIARKKELPLVALFSSGGVRQQENLAGLVQMERMVEAIRHFKAANDQPYISVLVGEVWGGVSASAAPLADLTIALAGTNYGFSGPRVIETYEGVQVPEGAQSAENNLIDRNIDTIVSNVDELIQYLDGFLKTTKKPSKEKLKSDNIPELRIIGEPEYGRIINLGRMGVAAAIYEHQDTEETYEVAPEQPVHPDNPKDQELMRRYESFISSPTRPDSEFVIQNAFSDVVPLYNHYVDLDKKAYPAIIAAVGKIGPQPFLVIGNQPSYKKLNGRIRKIPSTPSPKDIEYARRMLKMGERLDLPVVFLTDTLGAMPTMDSEERGISRSLAELIHDASAYKHAVMTIIISALGSGGGLATAPRGDYRAMLEHTHGYVAEPRSATSILYRNPERDDVQLTLSTMSATAEDQLRLGLIDAIIPESPSPYATVKSIHDAIAKVYPTIKSGRGLRNSRSDRIRAMRGMAIGRI